MLAVQRAKYAEGDQAFDNDVRIENDDFNHEPLRRFRQVLLAILAVLKIYHLDINSNARRVEAPTLETTLHRTFGGLSICQTVSIPNCL